MFKKTKYLLILLVLSGLASYSQNTNVSANMTGIDDGNLPNYYYVGNTPKTDTVKVKNGKFKWVAKMPEPW